MSNKINWKLVEEEAFRYAKEIGLISSKRKGNPKGKKTSNRVDTMQHIPIDILREIDQRGRVKIINGNTRT